VVVWIHGGGYQTGNISAYPGQNLVTDSHNRVIAVSIQYRLGAFGFLAGPEVQARGALNAGLLDQNFALQWVQKYISLFGGDPSKVTIWGESAGAGSVLQHVVAHRGQTDPPLFRAAITSSTYLPPQYAADDLIPTLVYDQMLNFTKCDDASDTFACLVSVDSDTLNCANDAVALSAFYQAFVFVPVVDGTFIVERPTITLDRQMVNGDVLLAVTNTFEGTTFTPPTETNVTDFIRQSFVTLSAQQIDKAASYYTALNATLPGALAQSIAVLGESIFIFPTYFLLKAFNGKAWKGEYAIPPGEHGEDVLYYFGPLMGYTRIYDNADFVQSFNQSFMNFIIFLDPNTKFDPTDPTPTWNHWSSDHTEMLFNETAAGEPDIRAVSTDSGLLERCEFWHSMAATIGQ
jgi:carboxylesterase type B